VPILISNDSKTSHPGTQISPVALAGPAFSSLPVGIDVVGEGTLQPNALKKLLDHGHPTELGEAHAIGCNTQMARPAGHYAQTSLFVRFHRKQRNSLPAQSEQGLSRFSQCS
jgi:hypothetical protein